MCGEEQKSRFCVVFLLLGAAFLLLPAAYAQDSVVCNPSGTQGELNQCARDEFNKQDTELNKLYHQRMAALKSPEAKGRLKKAQQSWIKFRDDTCLYEVGTREGSGSMWSMQYVHCKANITQKRVIDFRRYVSCVTLEDGCPM